MSAAAFFGHRDIEYFQYCDKLAKIIENLILDHGVDVFYNGARGNFDIICAKTLHELKRKYPHIKQLMELSYHPSRDFTCRRTLMRPCICWKTIVRRSLLYLAQI